MLGKHCIKTWSVSQGALALSSAEAELYAMIEGVTRAKGLLSIASELGFSDLSNVVRLGTDSSAAKSFVSRKGLGRMRHLEIRDLWLQKEIADGKLEVVKIIGLENPADLMTKVLGVRDIRDRLGRMNIRLEGTEGEEGETVTGCLGFCGPERWDDLGPRMYVEIQHIHMDIDKYWIYRISYRRRSFWGVGVGTDRIG